MQIDYNMMIITKDGVGILKDWKILWIKHKCKRNCNAVFQAVENRDFESVRKYVSDNIQYEGPEGLGSFNKAEPYLKYKEHLNLPKADIKKKFVDNNDVCLICDMIFDKQSVTSQIFSWYHVNDRKISSIKVALIHNLSLRKNKTNNKKLKK